VTQLISSGTVTNGPKPHELALVFGDGTVGDTHWTTSFMLPADYASGGTIRGVYRMATATSGTVVWKGSQRSLVNASTDDGAAAFATVTGTSALTVDATAAHSQEFSFALTTTSMAANRHCTVFIGRDADDTLATDNATGNAYLLSANLEYVTS
jgi:hypothetical protein